MRWIICHLLDEQACHQPCGISRHHLCRAGRRVRGLDRHEDRNGVRGRLLLAAVPPFAARAERGRSAGRCCSCDKSAEGDIRSLLINPLTPSLQLQQTTRSTCDTLSVLLTWCLLQVSPLPSLPLTDPSLASDSLIPWQTALTLAGASLGEQQLSRAHCFTQSIADLYSVCFFTACSCRQPCCPPRGGSGCRPPRRPGYCAPRTCGAHLWLKQGRARSG